MATKKRTGLGRGLSALIPDAPKKTDRDVDVFFDGSAPTGRTTTQGKKTDTQNQPDSELKAKTTTQKPESEAKQSNKVNTASTSNQVGKTAKTSKTETVPAQNEPDLVPVPGASLRLLNPQRIVPNSRQPRHEFEQEALDELIVSVKEFGVLQPIVVRPIAETDPRHREGEYELIMGERRLRATKAAGRTEIPAIVRETEDDAMLRDALLENLHRAELNPLEEASAYRQLLDDFGCTQDQLAERIGRSRPRISNTLRLLNLPIEVQRRVAAGVISAGHARAVLSVGESEAMTQLANRIVNEKLSVREAEVAAATFANRVGKTPSIPKRTTSVESESLKAHLDDVGERLGDRLNTRVNVVLRKTKGTITIDFASMSDLTRILSELGESQEH